MECEYSLDMEQMALFDSSPRWTVSTLTRYLRQLLEADTALQEVWVQGEISNLSRPASGHLYFTLKDSGASLKCVMWRKEAARMRITLQDGLAVEAHGSISLYEAGGQYQLYADSIRPLGEVTIPIRCAESGMGRLRAASNSPSASSKAFRRRNS